MRKLLILLVLLLYGCGRDEFKDFAFSYEVETLPATNIFVPRATLNGSVKMPGVSDIRYSFTYGVHEMKETKIASIPFSKTTEVSITVYDIEPGKRYYFYINVYVDGQVFRGETLTFRTLRLWN